MKRKHLEQLIEFFGTDQVLPVGSGTVGLALALETVGARGKSVIIPALTCPNVPVAVLAVGGVPVVADVSTRDYNIEPGSVAETLDRDVAAVVAVDSFGYPADVGRLRAAASRTGAVVIEDASQAYGGRAAGTVLGNRADIGIISFGYAKPVALNGGGLVVARDRDVFRDMAERLARRNFYRLRTLKNAIALHLMKKGRNRALAFLGSRIRLFEYRFPPHAAKHLASAWLRFVQELDDIRRNLHNVRTIMGELPGVKPFDYGGVDWLPWRLSFRVAGPTAVADVAASLRRSGICTSRLYPLLTKKFDLERAAPLRNATMLQEQTINLRYCVTRSATGRLVERMRRAADAVGATVAAAGHGPRLMGRTNWDRQA